MEFKKFIWIGLLTSIFLSYQNCDSSNEFGSKNKNSDSDNSTLDNRQPWAIQIPPGVPGTSTADPCEDYLEDGSECQTYPESSTREILYISLNYFPDASVDNTINSQVLFGAPHLAIHLSDGSLKTSSNSNYLLPAEIFEDLTELLHQEPLCSTWSTSEDDTICPTSQHAPKTAMGYSNSDFLNIGVGGSQCLQGVDFCSNSTREALNNLVDSIGNNFLTYQAL